MRVLFVSPHVAILLNYRGLVKPPIRQTVVCVFNFSATPQHQYRIGVPSPGHYAEILNSDSGIYGGSNIGNLGGRNADAVPRHGFSYSLELSLPPLGAVYLTKEPIQMAIGDTAL